MSWQPINTAPKDGTSVLAFGMAYPELADSWMRGWITAAIDKPRKPWIAIVKWHEHYYDKEIDNGDGTYRKERTLSSAGWEPHKDAFRPTHWMPLPNHPTEEPA